LINAGIGLTTQLIFNEGNSSNLDYGSLALDFGFGTLGSFVGAGVAAKTGGGLVSRIGFSTAFEGAFAGTEQVVRNLANGGSWSQDVRSAILSSILLQGGSEILSNSREVLQAVDGLADDFFSAVGRTFSDNRSLAAAGGAPSLNANNPIRQFFAAVADGADSANTNVGGVGNDLLEGVTPQSVLDGMSKKNLKHAKKHLPEFQQLDPNITDVSLRELGAKIVKPENLISAPDASQKAFQQVVEIGGTPTPVRVVLNERNKLHSVHIRRK